MIGTSQNIEKKNDEVLMHFRVEDIKNRANVDGSKGCIGEIHFTPGFKRGSIFT